MPNATELLDPEVLASVRMEFHEVFMQKRAEVRKLRVAVPVSTSVHSEHDKNQVASEAGTFAGTKRSREVEERPIRPLKRPRVIGDAPKTSPGTTREPCYRGLWENHAFVELSPTVDLEAVRRVRIREEMYEPFRAWKEVERGMATYDEHECYRICQINCFRSHDIRGTLLDRNEALTLDTIAAAIKEPSIMPTFPPLNVPAILKVESPDGQSATLALNRDDTGDHQATHQPLDLWPHLKPGVNILTIHVVASPTRQQGQPHVGHSEQDDGYIFVLQTTEPTGDHLELASLHPFQKDPFEGFRIAMQAIATKIKTAGTIE